MKRYFFPLLAALLVAGASAPSLHAQDEEIDLLESLLDVRVDAAAKYEQTAREAPASVSVVTAADIAQFGYRTLREALEHVRGFYMNDNLDEPYLGARGFGRISDFNNRVLVLVDGQVVNEPATGTVFLDMRLGVDLTTVERIEVVRGPGSTLYGSGAMFSVINIVTKAPSAQPGVSVGALTGSFGQVEGRAQVSRRVGREGGVTVSGYWGDYPGRDIYFAEYDAPETNHGVAAQQDWRQYNGLLVQGIYGGLTAYARVSSYDHGSPAGGYGLAFNHDSTRHDFHMKQFGIAYENELSSDKHLQVQGKLAQGYLRSSTAYEFSGYAPFVLSDQGNDVWYGGEVQYRWDTSPSNRLFLGVDYSYSNIDYHIGDGTTVLSEFVVTYWTYSFFAQNEYRFTANLAATVGLRYDHYSTIGGGVTPRLAVVYNASRASTLKLLYGHAFRAPSISDLYLADDRVGIIDNPNLAPERMRTVEAVWEHEWHPGFVTALSVYDYRLDDLIDRVFDQETSFFQNQNVGRATARGVEAEVNARLTSGLRAYASYAYQRARDGASGDKLWSSPEHLAKAGAALPVRTLGTVSLQTRYESARRTIYSTETEPFVVADLTVRSAPLLGGLRATLYLRNVFNTDYRFPGTFSHRQHTLIQPGRTLSIQLSYGL